MSPETIACVRCGNITPDVKYRPNPYHDADNPSSFETYMLCLDCSIRLPERHGRYTYEQIALDYLMRLNAERGPMPDWYHLMKLWEEAGEVPKEYLKWQGLHRHADETEGSGEKVQEELADTVITCFALAHLWGWDLDAAIQKKHAILMRRAMSDDK